MERSSLLVENRERIRTFRSRFLFSDPKISIAVAKLPKILVGLYTDCQAFAEKEIKSLLEKFGSSMNPGS